MNLSTVALILLAWQLLGSGDKPRRTPPQMDLKNVLSDDVKQMINSAQRLSDKNCTQAERAGAIFEIMANPALQSLAGSIFGTMGSQNNEASPPPPQEPECKTEEPNVNAEGYRFETPSPATQEFFRPIDNIADAEVKHKLYWFYENWYIK